MKSAVLLSFLLSFVVSRAAAREWQSADGKKLEAEFVSSDAETVTLARPNGQKFTIPLSRLADIDQSWIRLQKDAPKAEAKANPITGPYAALITGDWKTSDSDGLNFAIYGSKSLDASLKYPLVLALHGKSKNEENGKQVGGWMKSFTKQENYSVRPCFIVAPLSAQPEAGEGVGWNGQQVDQVIKLVKTLVKELPVDPKRIYIVGHSMGGYGTCHVMGSEPRLFAAAIPVAGVSQDDVSNLARKPIWMFHAADDTLVPVAGAREFAESMKQDKLFKFTESPTGGHGVVEKVFADAATHQWLFDQRLK